jgi:peptide/nickel transport system substrate-binding protein/oligopeptide transport system substrate-binding protein
MKRYRVLFLLLVSVALAFSSLTIRAQEEKVLRVVLNPDMRTSDPHIAYETETWPTASLFYVGLVKLQDAFTPVPALAESWTVNETGTVYTFTLREGIKFSNGRAITTEDVKYSFERLMNPKTASPTAFMFASLVGAAEVQAGTASEVSGVKILDARQIEFSFTTPVWSIMQRFALPPGFIVAKEGVEAAGDEFARKPLGAGPFMLESWESGIKITGVRNPNYFEAGQPVYDRFELQLGVEPSVGILKIESGEADISLDFVPNADYPRLAGDAALSPRLIPLPAFPNTDYIIINNNIEPFDKLEVRQAMNMAIDRERLTTITNGRSVPSAGLIPPSVAGNNADLKPPAYDPEGAKKMLADAGFPNGFATEMLSNTDPTAMSIAQAVIADLSAIGITVELTSIDNAQFLNLLVTKPESLRLVMTEWYNDYLDPSNNWEPLLKCDGSYNWAKFCNKELDALFEQINLLPPTKERWEAFADFEAKVSAVVPNLFLEHRVNYYFTSDKVNIEADPAILLRFASASPK